MTPGEFAQIALECLRVEIQDGPYPMPDDKICLRFGQQVNPSVGTAEDECCTGLAWVRVAGVESLADPTDPAQGNCVTTARRITLELGTARCIPFGTTGAGPTCEQWTEATLKMDADQQAMEAALCCAMEAFHSLPFEPRLVPGLYEPFGPDGNCLTGTLQATIDYDCGCANVA